MRSPTPCLMLTLAFVSCIQKTMTFPSGTVKERDTDQQEPNLHDKLQRLHELLSELEQKDPEDDLQKVSAAHPTSVVPKAEEVNVQEARSVSSKDMGRKYPEAGDSDYLTSRDSEAIQMLARALSRLDEPSYNKEESHGERLKAQNKPQNADKIQQLEKTIQRALTRLDRERTEPSQPQENKQDVLNDRDKDMLRQKFHEEALNMIEERMVRDLVLASKLGVSVDNLIDDLEERAYEAAAIRRLEEGLDENAYRS